MAKTNRGEFSFTMTLSAWTPPNQAIAITHQIREHLHLYVPEHLRNTYGALLARHKNEVDNLDILGFDLVRREI